MASRLRVALACWALLAAPASCNTNPHYIGDVCPGAPAGTSACVTFEVGLDHSGVSRLPFELALPGGPVLPIERLRGETAMDGVWTADVGGELNRSTGAPALDLEAPFTDDTRAVGFVLGSPSYLAPVNGTAALGGDDFAVEVVLRASAGARLFGKSAPGAGWALNEIGDGALALGASDGGGGAVGLVSAPLVEGAWHHCVAWVSRAEGGRIDCNGREGSPVDASALGDLDVATNFSAGGGDAGGRVALLAIYRVPRGGLGPAAGWRDIGARRFALLTGAGAAALGSALPKPDLRDSPATLDLQRGVGEPRRLFLVGPDWPRVACRSDAQNARDCGYLSEPARERFVPAGAGGFSATDVIVRAGAAPFADGEPRMEALVPSTVLGVHTLAATSRFDAAYHVFSFFARAGAASRVAASAGNFGLATFDVSAGTVVSTPPGVEARIEAWGDGLFRCAYGFGTVPGPTAYKLQLVEPGAPAPDDSAPQPFTGDGVTPSIFVAGLQVDVGLRAPGSLLAADQQAADRLAFVANDGNLPARAAVSFAMRVLAPATPRSTDQPILTLHRGGRAQDEVRLFVSGGVDGSLAYDGVWGGMRRWLIHHETPLADGRRHVIEGAWSATSARLAINGIVDNVPVPGGGALALDEIAVAFSPRTSDHLEGLVAGLRLSTP